MCVCVGLRRMVQREGSEVLHRLERFSVTSFTPLTIFL